MVRPKPTPPAPVVEVSAAELARLAGYSKMQVTKWGPMGLSKLGRVIHHGTHKRILYRRDEALAWIKGNATGLPVGRGGKRVGSGRKKGRPSAIGPRQSAKPSTPEHLDTSTPAPAPPPRRLTPPLGLERESFGLRSHAPAGDAPKQETASLKHWDEMSQQEKLEYLSPTRDNALTQVQVKQILDAQKVLTEELARKEKERTLISVEEAKKAWTEFLTAAARSLVHQRNALAQALISENGLPVTLLDRFKIRIEQENQKVITAMRAALIDERDGEEA